MWQPINTAPFDRDLELAVINSGEPHVLVFPCRRILSGWVNAETKSKSKSNRRTGGNGITKSNATSLFPTRIARRVQFCLFLFQ